MTAKSPRTGPKGKAARSRGPRRSSLVRELTVATPTKPDHPIQPSQSEAPFSPSANQLKYLFALRAAATDGTNTSDAEMQRVTKISRMTMWEWKHDPGFRRWLSEAMRTEHDHDFELAVVRHSRLAIQGSVRSFEALARLRSIGIKIGFGQSNAPESPAAYTVNLLVPRPGGEP